MADRREQEREILRAALGRTKDCPPAEELAQLAAREPGSPLTAHVESCEWCRSELKLYQAFESADEDGLARADVDRIAERLRSRSGEIFRSAEAGPEVRQSWWQAVFAKPWLTPAALAMAGVLVLVAVGLEWRSNGPLSVGNVPDSAVMRSASLTVVAPVGDLAEAPKEIQWQPVAGAAKYEVRLREVDHTEMWTTETVETRAGFPPAVQARLVPAKTVLCQVTALDAAGRTIAESTLVRFRVAPAAQ